MYEKAENKVDMLSGVNTRISSYPFKSDRYIQYSYISMWIHSVHTLRF